MKAVLTEKGYLAIMVDSSNQEKEKDSDYI
jgi:hypothetical protein